MTHCFTVNFMQIKVGYHKTDAFSLSLSLSLETTTTTCSFAFDVTKLLFVNELITGI